MLSNAGRNTLLVVAALIVGFGIIEVTVRVLAPVELRLMGTDIRLPYFKRYEVKIENPRVLEKHTVHVKNALGFRGPNRPKDFENYISVIAIGGSTTECFVLGDGKDWPAVLGNRLGENFKNVWVNNAGMNGHTTFGHIKMMEQHVGKIRPKIALFLVGLNDTTFQSNSERFDVRLDWSYNDDLLHRAILLSEGWLSRHSHAIALLYQAHRQLRADQFHDQTGSVEAKFVSYVSNLKAPTEAQVKEWHDEIAKNKYYGYLDRLDRLVALARENGIEPVFVTQPGLPGPGFDPVSGIPLDRLRTHQSEATSLMNQQLMKFGETRDVLVIDAASALPRTSNHYYDLWHYTNQGAEEMAAIINEALCPFIAERFPGHVTAPCRTASR